MRGCGPLSPLYDEALTCAASLHRDQLRKNTRVAYIAHLVAVSSLVLEDGGTETEAIAGLLHDAIEDCGAQAEPILRQRFGDAVVDIVAECSDAAPVDGEPKPLLTAWLDDTGARHKFWSRIRDRSSTDISTTQPRAGQIPAAAADAIGVLLVAMFGGETPHPALDTEDQEEESR